MTRRQKEKRLYEELLAKYGQEIAQAFAVAVADLRRNADVQSVIAALERNDIDAALDALHLDPAAFEPVETKIREAFIAGGQAGAANLPRAVGIGVRFNVGNPRAEAWLRAHGAEMVTRILADDRAGIRTILADGVRDGRGPRPMALEMVGRVSRATGAREGGIIGLSAPQMDYLASARRELASDDPEGLRNYLSRALRDRRYDRAVAKALRDGARVPAETARNAATAYSNRMLRHRGESIGQHEAHAAVRRSKLEAYEQLIDSGNVPAAAVKKRWARTSSRAPRDSHLGMVGQTVGLREPFVSPTGARMMHPGDGSLGAGPKDLLGCQCDMVVEIVQPEDDQ